MYGTIAKLKVKPGQVEALKSHMAAVTSRHEPGFVSVNVYQMDADPTSFTWRSCSKIRKPMSPTQTAPAQTPTMKR